MLWVVGNYWNFSAILFGVLAHYRMLALSGRNDGLLKPNLRSQVGLLRA